LVAALLADVRAVLADVLDDDNVDLANEIVTQLGERLMAGAATEGHPS
jgi:hypothetical protein